MPLVPLSEVLSAARARGGAALGLVCLGWGDVQTFVRAGEAAGVPVILQAGPGARAAIPVEVWGAMFRAAGAGAGVPVVAHLDHGRTVEECRAGLEAGFTSVMFDGSALPLAENIARTAEVLEMARAAGASVEAEVGVVGYDAGAASEGTDPDEAEAFWRACPVDALAVSVGNVHLQRAPGMARIDWARLSRIRDRVGCPLVLHGGSGVAEADRARAAREGVAKINLGTELRQAYGAGLRHVLDEDADRFDRLAIDAAVTDRMVPRVADILRRAWDGPGAS